MALTLPSASLRAPLSQNLGEGTLERSDSGVRALFKTILDLKIVDFDILGH